ncbi:hypothetical protein LSG31_22675 [Fodinisporobacter ferrooxydans]|uniref:Electron transfer flavoprotein alpha/beta-subunit N-terminal domain-containing protein n=1 Tax=Fodinisporobacter ferrooxydans TaxID=2901836 RepID=A0ABY4CUP2_9BACL|nr:hypothetical protein LSG31_22675 [Alicyclobacillaceae bacterium MYW30-H2]
MDDEALFEDEFVAVKMLAAFARQERYELIFGGQMSVDNGSAQTGPRLAEELGIPLVTAIRRLMREETFPEPKSRARCTDCEYRRYCNDVR